MQSLWRVACVRIPRFPIGAVWRAARSGALATQKAGDAQLLLPFTPPSATLPSLSSPQPNSGAPSSVPVHWDDLPIALVDAAGKRMQAVSAAAGRVGVRAGMRPAEARDRKSVV